MTWWAWVLIGGCVVIGFAVYCCCIMAGRADEAMGGMHERTTDVDSVSADRGSCDL